MVAKKKVEKLSKEDKKIIDKALKSGFKVIESIDKLKGMEDREKLTVKHFLIEQLLRSTSTSPAHHLSFLDWSWFRLMADMQFEGMMTQIEPKVIDGLSKVIEKVLDEDKEAPDYFG